MPKKFKFGGGNKCFVCGKTVYVQEQVTYEGKFLHEDCFKCSICNKKIATASQAGSMDGKIFHRKCSHDLMLSSGGRYGGKAVKNKAQRDAEAAANAGGDSKADDGAAAAAAEAKAAEKAAADAKAADAKAADAKAADAKAAEAKKAAADKKAADKAAADVKAAEAKAAAPAKAEEKKEEGPKWVYEGGNRKIWFLENIPKTHGITEPMKLSPDTADTVYLGKIDGMKNQVVVILETKCKAITINSCKKIAVVCQDVVARIEVVNTEKLQCQIVGTVPIIQVDKTNQTSFYLSEACQALEPSTMIYSSSCTGVNIVCPDPNDAEGDQLERAIPEQVKSFVDENNKMQSSIIIVGEEE